MGAEGAEQLVHRDGILWADVDGEVVVYDPDAGRAHLLSDTGSLLWPALSSPVTIVALAADVADVFGLNVGDAEDQVGSFCAELVDLRLLVPVADAAPDA